MYKLNRKLWLKISSKVRELLPPTVVTILLTIFFIAACFLARSAYTQVFEHGGDAINKWQVSEQISNTGDFTLLVRKPGKQHQIHHSARWGVNLPTALFMKVIGTGLESYFIIPLLLFSMLFVLMAKFAKDTLRSPLFFSFLLFLFIEPMFFRASNQLQPFVFGVFYLTLAVWAIIIHIRKGHIYALVLSAFFAFLAYGCKETYIFFYPGILLFLLFKIGFRRACLYSVVLFLLLCLETILFNYLADFEMILGRIELLFFGSHMSRMGRPDKFTLGVLFTKAWQGAPLFNQLIAAITVIYFVIIVAQKKYLKLDNVAAVFLSMSISYILLNTFVLKSYELAIPLQPPKVKYLTPMMPFCVYCSVYAIQKTILLFNTKGRKIASYTVLGAAILLAVNSLFFNPIIKYRHKSIEYPKSTAYCWHAKKHIAEILSAMNEGYGIEVKDKKKAEYYRYWIEKDMEGSGVPGELNIMGSGRKNRIIHSSKVAGGKLRGCISVDLENPREFTVEESRPCAKTNKKRLRTKRRRRSRPRDSS